MVGHDSLGLDKQRGKRLDYSKRAPDVDVVQSLRLGDVNVQQRSNELDPGCVDQDVEFPTRALRDRIHSEIVCRMVTSGSSISTLPSSARSVALDGSRAAAKTRNPALEKSWP